MERYDIDNNGKAWRRGHGHWVEYEAAQARIADLEADVARLNSAMQEIYDCGDYGMAYHEIATRALKRPA